MMKKTLHLLLTLGLFWSMPLFAQEEPVDYNMVYKIKQEGLNNSEVMDIAFYLTDVSGPRLTNSPGYARAANWVKGEI